MNPALAVKHRPRTPFFPAGRGLLAALWWTTSTCVVGAADPMGDEADSFILRAEARLRYEWRDQPGGGAMSDRLLARGVLGGEVRRASGFRARGEIAMGDVSADRRDAGANLHNALSLQQLWVEIPWRSTAWSANARVGRQEFDDGPRQLVSVSDGPNVHRTWNGARFALQRADARLTAFAFRATQLGRHGLDERISRIERLGGVTARLPLPLPGAREAWSIEPFWFHTAKQSTTRDTVGARLCGRRGGFALDWVAAAQTGRSGNRSIDAWAVFAAQSFELTPRGWKPRIGLRVDVASGGGADRAHATRNFDPLYASSSYLGEGLFLSASNLVMVTPGLSLAPTARWKIAFDYGFARRLEGSDAAYAGQMRAYPGTRTVAGREIGGLWRVKFQWSVSPRVTIDLNYEHLARGEVLARAQLPSRSYAHGAVTFRY